MNRDVPQQHGGYGVHKMNELNFMRRQIARIWLLIAFSGAAPIASAALLNPSLERIEQCVEPISIMGYELKSTTYFGTLFYMYTNDPSLKNSVDTLLLRPFSIAGYLTGVALSKESPPVRNGDSFTLTGVIYLRHPSLPEKWINNSKVRILYEVSIDDKAYLISQVTLGDEIWPVCTAARS